MARREDERQAAPSAGAATRGAGALSWPRVYALAVLQLVVTLGWMAYASFQEPLLGRFGFGSLSGALSLYLGLAGATLAPLVGGLGDRIAARGSDRVLLLVTGGMLAGATFVGVASTLSAADPAGSVRWIALALVLAWIAAMTVLQAPALSLLPRVAAPDRWPVAVAPLVVATVLPTALWPLVARALAGLGGVVAFAAGGGLVVAATLLSRRSFATAPRAIPPSPERSGETAGLGLFGLVFAAGIASAFVTRLASDIVPGILATIIAPDTGPALLSAATLGVGAVLAPMLGGRAVSIGTRSGTLGSAAVAALCGIVAPLATSIAAAIVIAVLLGAALALHLVCALPFSLATLPSGRAGLSAGLYLGGAFAGSQLASLVPWLGTTG